MSTETDFTYPLKGQQLLDEFVRQFGSGAQGVSMDCDAVKDLCEAISAPAQCTLASNATTISCSGKDITIACDDHDTKQAVMDALTGDGEPVAYFCLDCAEIITATPCCDRCGSPIIGPVVAAPPSAMHPEQQRIADELNERQTTMRHDKIAALRPSQAAAVLPAASADAAVRLAERIAKLKTFTNPKTGREAVDIFVETDLRDLIVAALTSVDRLKAMEMAAKGEYSEIPPLGDSKFPAETIRALSAPAAAAVLPGREEDRQLFVVDGLDNKSGKVSSVYVFNNHGAALACRQELGLNQDHLRGCVVFSEWREGQPLRALARPPELENEVIERCIKAVRAEAVGKDGGPIIDPTDISYNAAIGHAVEAIRALRREG